jgi:hypothetical protein
MQASKTYFEQIPVETVKAIAKEFPEKNAIESERERTETQKDVRAPHESWRDLAQEVQHEQDSRRMNELAKRLVAVLGEEMKLRRG